MILRYASTIFLSALLLFLVQPLMGKYILPWFGGGPSIWTACMLFFQVLLLGGYLYAHCIGVGLNLRKQAIVHLTLLLGSLAFLPIAPAEGWKPQGDGSPVGQILMLLLLTVGGPFFMLSSTGPLIQHWFSRSVPGRSPYRLYALSNIGSLLALISYPFLVEPVLRLRDQVFIWSGLYVAYVALGVWCSVSIMKLKVEPEGGASQLSLARRSDDAQVVPPSVGRMLLWLSLAAMGSALLLATTNQLCIDIAVVPFLWILPLSLYLLTFVICFDNPRWYDRRVFGLLLIVSVSAACWLLKQGFNTSVPLQIGVYAVAMFACCMACHGELVRSRPDPRYLTLFYVMVSAGGALGGALVAVGAPALFIGFWEFPLALFGACLLTLLAWYIGQAWRTRPSMVFWIWASVAAIQGLLVSYLVSNVHEGYLESIGQVVLVGVYGGILLIACWWTATRENAPRALAWLWTTVTLLQLVWIAAFVLLHDPQWTSAASVASIVPGIVALSVGGFLLSILTRRRIRHSLQKIAVVVSLQLVVIIALGLMWYFQWVDSRQLVGLIGVCLVVGILDAVRSRWTWKSYFARGAWFWGPLLVPLGLLGLDVTDFVLVDAAEAIHKSRNFYGVLRVTLEADDENGEYYSLTHGQIEHGLQYVEGPLHDAPTTYYGPASGLGLAIRLHPRRATVDPARCSFRVGIVGLGTGTIAAYGQRDDYYRFYEINPAVVELAGKYFSYLEDSEAECEIVLGDARVSMERELQEEEGQNFDVLAIDAFTSDAIPVHLLTAQCAEVYRRHLKPDGLLAMHISNRYLDLNPIARALAQQLGWHAIRIDTDDDADTGSYGATWIILTANEAFATCAEIEESHWPWEDDEPQPLLWTDDFAGLWHVFSY